MKFSGFLAVFSFTAFTIANAALADADNSCSEIGHVSGWVKTINLNESMQTGFVKLDIQVDGEIFFKRKGVIIGQIVDQGFNELGLPTSTLEHNMYFGKGIRLETAGDKATLIPTGKLENGIPCEFNVVEMIMDATGTRRLKGLSNDQHNIIATGTVSFCSDNNANTFDLAGTVCIN